MEQLRVNVRMDLFENIVKTHGEKTFVHHLQISAKIQLVAATPVFRHTHM